MRLLSIALLLLVSTSSRAPQLTPREREAYDYLRKIEQLQMPTVGFASQYSGGYLALRIVSRSPHASEAFQALLREGKLAGQLYALAGLQRVDPAYFGTVVPKYQDSNDEVVVFAGCIMGKERVSSVIQRLRSFAGSARDEEEAREAEAKFDFKR